MGANKTLSRFQNIFLQDFKIMSDLVQMFKDLPLMLYANTRSVDEFEEFWRLNNITLGEIKCAEDGLLKKYLGKSEFTFSGYSEPSQETVSFQVNVVGGQINWRESMLCPITGLNNRSRASISILLRECGLTPNSNVYITEQTTVLWDWLKKFYPKAVGSEYYGSKCPLGDSHEGIRNEDMTKLTFPSSSFDVVASFDVLEHVPEYSHALYEVRRVIKSGGYLLMSFPFTGLNETLVRAKINTDDAIEYLVEPEYHGDPLNSEGGILCYYHFGFDILKSLLEVGFSDAKVVWIWSRSLGYLGGMQPYIVAKK